MGGGISVGYSDDEKKRIINYSKDLKEFKTYKNNAGEVVRVDMLLEGVDPDGQKWVIGETYSNKEKSKFDPETGHYIHSNESPWMRIEAKDGYPKLEIDEFQITLHDITDEKTVETTHYDVRRSFQIGHLTVPV